MWQTQYGKYNVTYVMWLDKCDKWNVTNEMWQMQCDKRYVTMQYDKCNVLDRPASQTNEEDQLSGPARQTR